MTACARPEMEPSLTNRCFESSDELLLPAAQAGDPVAFVELVDRHAKKVKSRLFQIMRNQDDAEDVFQETIIRAFVHIKFFERRSSFSTWLTRIAINSALMRLRRRRWVEIPLEPSLYDCEQRLSWEPADSRDTPEEALMKREREELLNRAILALPPSLRAVVQLQHAQNCSSRDIAQHLGISLPAVKSRLSRARRRLRVFLKVSRACDNEQFS